MSRFEETEYVNDRYKAIEDRLKVGQAQRPAAPGFAAADDDGCRQSSCPSTHVAYVVHAWLPWPFERRMRMPPCTTCMSASPMPAP